MIFARKADDALASLVKDVEKQIEANKSQRLSAFVNLIGDDREELEATAKKFIQEHGIRNVPITVPVEFEHGPADFGVNPQAETTVTMYVGTQVKASHAFGAGKLDDEGRKAVSSDVSKIVK